MIKRVIAVLMSAMIMVTFMPAMSFADSTRDLFEVDGVVYYVDKYDQLYIDGVNSDFDGTFVSKVHYKGQTYEYPEFSSHLKWMSNVKTVRIPSVGFSFDAYAFRMAKSVEKFEVYDQGDKEPLYEYYVDSNGLLYECEWLDDQISNYVLLMCPPAKKGLTEVGLDEHCTDISEYAFDYSASKETITKLILQNDAFYIDPMDYEDSACLYDRLALKSDGKYNLTIRITSPGESDNIASFVKYVKYCQKNAKEGIKLEAPLEGCHVRNTSYANRNKARQVVFGDVVLTEGEDYEFGDCSKDGKKLSCDSYCVLITGSNHFFLGSDEEPWEDFSVVSEYSVIPNKVNSVKYTSGKKKFTVKWKADKTKYGSSKYVTGYQIAYRNQDYDDAGYTVKKVKGYKASSKTIKSLSKGYYDVKMRSYKSLGDGNYVYSAWTTVKTVKVK